MMEVIVLDKTIKSYRKAVETQVHRLAKFLPRKGEIEVYLVSGRRMRNLNRRFRGKNRSTNVLSFPKPKNFPGNKLGEVFLDPAYIKIHKEDLGLMLVHGVLHILGYDHERRSDRIRMERKEAKLLSLL